MRHQTPTPEDLCAIVIGHVDYSEHDRIVRLLSAEHGLISAMARGALRPKNKTFSHSLDIGNRIRISINRSKTPGALWKLKEASLEKACHRARQSLFKTALLTYCCEVISMLAQPENEEPKLFALLSKVIEQLNAAGEGFGDRYRIAVELKSLAFCGLTPTLRRCVACTEPLEDNYRFYKVEGGIFHNKCLPKRAQVLSPQRSELDDLLGVEISEAWRQAALLTLYSPLEQSIGINMPPGPKWLFSEMIEQYRQRQIRSKNFLLSLEKL